MRIGRRALFGYGLVAARDFPHLLPQRRTRYVAPDASPRGNGDGWSNAAPLNALNDMIGEVGPGGTVLLAADRGPYDMGSTTLPITRGGEAASRVSVMGVDRALAPRHALLTGDRATWTLPPDPETVTQVGGWAPGVTLFRLEADANHLTFRFLSFRDCGQPFQLAGSRHLGIEVVDCRAHNVRRFFEHEIGTSHVGTHLRRIDVLGFSKTAIRIRGDSQDVLLEDVMLNSGRQDGDDFATGVECNDTAHAIVMRRVVARNCHDSGGSKPGAFWNADGFASELGNRDIIREDCVSAGNTDAGYDDKGSGIRNIRCLAYGNNINFKMWSRSIEVIDCQAIEPKSRSGPGAPVQYYVFGSERPDSPGADIVVRRSLSVSDDPRTFVFQAEGHNSVFRIASPRISRHGDSAITSSLKGCGNAFLFADDSDGRTPEIALPANARRAAGRNFALFLRADKPVTWSLLDRFDAAAFGILPDRREATLTLAACSDTATRRIVVQATDGNANIATHDLTVSVSGTADAFFRDAFPPGTKAPGSLGWRLFPPGASPDGGLIHVSPNCGFLDHHVKVTVGRVPDHRGPVRRGESICCRVSAGGGFVGLGFSTASMTLYRHHGGTTQILAETASSVEDDEIHLEVNGSDAVVRRNGSTVLRGQVPSTRDQGATRSGILSPEASRDLSWIKSYEAGP